MKKILVCLVLFCMIAAAMLPAGCALQGGERNTSSGASTNGQTAAEREIAGASTTEELQTLLDRYEQAGDYAAALLAADKLIGLGQAGDDLYLKRAQLWIEVLKEADASLNDTVRRDISSLADPTAYRDALRKLYDDAGLSLQIPFIPDYADTTEINTAGSTPNNLTSGVWSDGFKENYTGLFTAQGDWIYYAAANEGFALYKQRTGAPESRRLICPDGACGINVIGDWIYFINLSDNHAIWRIRTDGSDKARLTADPAGCLCAIGDWIYYTNTADGSGIYRIRTDGTARDGFTKPAHRLFPDGDYLYFSTPDDRNLLRTRIGGTGDVEFILKNEWNINAKIVDGWLYYLTDRNGMVLAKCRPDGSEYAEIWRYDAKVNHFSLSGGTLLVSVRDDMKTESIYLLDLATLEQKSRIESISSEAICTAADGTVYFINELDGRTWNELDLETQAITKIG